MTTNFHRKLSFGFSEKVLKQVSVLYQLNKEWNYILITLSYLYKQDHLVQNNQIRYSYWSTNSTWIFCPHSSSCFSIPILIFPLQKSILSPLSWSFILITQKDSKLSAKPGSNYHCNSCSNNCYSSTYSITYNAGTTSATQAPDQSTMSAHTFPSQQASRPSLGVL